ncbi:hypothetical protein HOD29_02295 [archaeon]|jgi:hypothetical protein|nr:hypothetical protein [archaeon]
MDPFGKAIVRCKSILKHDLGNIMVGVESEEFISKYEKKLKERILQASLPIGNQYLLLNSFLPLSNQKIKDKASKLVESLKNFWEATLAEEKDIKLKEIHSNYKKLMADYEGIYEFYTLKTN